MRDVVLLNVHGGFPSAMIERALLECAALRALCAESTVYDRVYATCSSAAGAMHDTLVADGIGGRGDGEVPTRTLFGELGDAGAATRVFGPFGLTEARSPARLRYVAPEDMPGALRAYGFDECELEDAAFGERVSTAHDALVVERAVDHLLRPSSNRPRAVLINLLGCADLLDAPLDDLVEAADAVDERDFASNVFDDDASDQRTGAGQIDALWRAARLRGARQMDRAARARAIAKLHALCWDRVVRFDRAVAQLVGALERTRRPFQLYVYSDRPVALHEHGTCTDAPWEACTRSFLVRRTPGRTGGGRVSRPTSLARLPGMVLEDGNHEVGGWPRSQRAGDDEGCVTLGLTREWLARAQVAPPVDARALRTFFVRVVLVHHDRRYAVVAWFSLNDLGAERSSRRWPNPLATGRWTQLQVFEHATDPGEMRDLTRTAEWRTSKVAGELEEKVQAVMVDHDLETLRLHAPLGELEALPRRSSTESSHQRIMERTDERRREQQRKEVERKEAERKEAERRERERKEAAQRESARKEAEERERAAQRESERERAQWELERERAQRELEREKVERSQGLARRRERDEDRLEALAARAVELGCAEAVATRVHDGPLTFFVGERAPALVGALPPTALRQLAAAGGRVVSVDGTSGALRRDDDERVWLPDGLASNLEVLWRAPLLVDDRMVGYRVQRARTVTRAPSTKGRVRRTEQHNQERRNR